MTITPPPALVEELSALGPAGRRRAAASAATMFASDVSVPAPAVDPVPVVLEPEAWSSLTAGLTQRARLLDALHADLYGPRTVLSTEVAPVAELLADPAYLRPAVGIPSRGPHHLFAVTTTVSRTAEGTWVAHEDTTDVPRGAGLALELRRALSRCAPTLYRSTAMRRLHPFFDALRTSFHQRTRSEGRIGRTVVLADDGEEPLAAFDHSWLANLLGAPTVSVGDLRAGGDALTLRLPGLDSAPGDAVDAVLRLVPSPLLDPLDLGPTPLGGVTGLVEAARCGDVELLNPLGAGLLENPALREALPDLCRQMLHEDLLLRPAPAELAPAWWTSLDPSGGEELVDRPVRLDLLVMATEDGFEVLPGGIARTADDGPETLKDVWVAVPESAAMPDEEAAASTVPDRVMLRSAASTFPTMTRSIGADLFWFGRYLERVDATARLLRTVLDASNDLDAERSRSARTAREVLLRAVTDVTTTYPGFMELDLRDGEAVRTEIESLLTDPGRPGSLAQSSAALAHTTRSLRDLFSDDVWPAFTRMRLRARGGVAEPRPLEQPPLEQWLSAVVDGCLTLSGAVADAMPRDLGWDLTEIGRKIERTMTLLALLRATFGHRRARGAEERIAGAVAQITESGVSYRRSYHAAVQPELLVELLMEDATLPRSLAFQLDRLGQALDRLPEPAPSPELRAPMAALRTRLAGWEPHELLRPLPEAAPVGGATPAGAPTALLTEVDAATDSLRALATALEDRFFRPTEATSRWGVDDV